MSIPQFCEICIELCDDGEIAIPPCGCGFLICTECLKKLTQEYQETRCPQCRKEYDPELLEERLEQDFVSASLMRNPSTPRNDITSLALLRIEQLAQFKHFLEEFENLKNEERSEHLRELAKNDLPPDQVPSLGLKRTVSEMPAFRRTRSRSVMWSFKPSAQTQSAPNRQTKFFRPRSKTQLFNEPPDLQQEYLEENPVNENRNSILDIKHDSIRRENRNSKLLETNSPGSQHIMPEELKLNNKQLNNSIEELKRKSLDKLPERLPPGIQLPPGNPSYERSESSRISFMNKCNLHRENLLRLHLEIISLQKKNNPRSSHITPIKPSLIVEQIQSKQVNIKIKRNHRRKRSNSLPPGKMNELSERFSYSLSSASSSHNMTTAAFLCNDFLLEDTITYE